MSSVLFRRALVGDFLVALPSSKASSTLIVIHKFFLFQFVSILPYVIMQMSEFHLVGIYSLFISILRNTVGLTVWFGAPLTGLNSPVVILLLPVPRRCPLCSINMLFVDLICMYFMFAYACSRRSPPRQCSRTFIIFHGV